MFIVCGLDKKSPLQKLHYGFRHNSEAMIHMGLSLLTVALESGSHHIGTFPSLMNYVKDDMCKNLFWVGIL